MMTDDPFTEEAGDTLPVDLDQSQTAENSEMGDRNKNLYMEQEAHSLNLTHQGYPVTLHTQSCVVCHSFSSTRTLARDHFDIQHGGQLFECRFCRLTFVLECNLRQHNELHHGMKLTKLKNSPEILRAEGPEVTTTTLEKIIEGLIDDVVDSATKGSHGLLNQKDNDNCMNKEELDVTVTNFPNVATAKRELKFEKNKGKEWTPRGIITNRNLYIQRHSKNLKKLRDIILKRSIAKRKDALTIDLQGKKSKKTRYTKVSQTQRKETIPDSIKTTGSGCNANKLTKSSASESKAIAISEGGTEAPTTEGGTEAPTSEGGTKTPITEQGTGAPTTERGSEPPITEEGIEAPITEGGIESPITEEGIEAPITEGGIEAPTTDGGIEASTTEGGTDADASLSRDKKGNLAKVLVKDTTISNQPNSKDSRLWCKHCNISFKTKHTLRKHTVYSLFHKLQINEETMKREICYDCKSTFANKNNLLRHQLLKCYFRNKSRETPKCSKIQLTELSDVEGKANSTGTPKKLIPDDHTSTWKSTENNISIDELSTSHSPCERNKEHTNTSIQHTNLVKNLAKFGKHLHPPCVNDNTHIQTTGLVEQNIVDCIPQAVASGDEPTHETLHDTPTIEHSVFTIEEREQTSQNRDKNRATIPKNHERGRMGVSTATAIERGTGCVNDSTVVVDLNHSIELPGIKGQVKTLHKKQKYTPTTCDGCGAPFASRQNCRRHILNSCTFYKGVTPLSPQNRKQMIEIPSVDTRKASKRSSDAVAPASTKASTGTRKVFKLQITCEDCGKQFSRRSKYRRHARKHEDLPKIKSEFSKTRPRKANHTTAQHNLERVIHDLQLVSTSMLQRLNLVKEGCPV